jgi:TatD family-associated radical SAM protein
MSGQNFGKAMTVAYPLNDALYLNITNRCQNKCQFCIRNTAGGVGYDLWLEHEPTVAEIQDAIGTPSGYREIVFCGYGEPLSRPEVLIEVARWLKEKNPQIPIRLNTNGLADLFLDFDVLPGLQGLIDTISISLNAHDAATYTQITQSPYGEKSFSALLEFTKRSKLYIPTVILTVVRQPEVDLDQAAKICRELGVEFRIREYQG